MGGESTVRPLVLGIEGGGTRTVALVADERGRILKRAEFGPLNSKLLSDQEILKRLRKIKNRLALQPSSLAVRRLRSQPQRTRRRIMRSR